MDARELADADDATLDEVVTLATAATPTTPAGVEACAMGGNKGFRGKGGPDSACHLHDGTPDSMRSAMRKALRDVGTAKPPPSYTEKFSELETENLVGVPLMASGGPYFGQGSPEAGDYFDDKHLGTIATNTGALADEVRIPIKLGHGRSQKLLKNSGLFHDEMPAAGWVNARNLRVANGQLLGDLMNVPKKLSALIKAGAFRTRSVELSRITSQKQGGKVFESVITGLALLGAKAPAIRTLDDIVALYSDATPEPRFAEGIEATPLMVFSTTVVVADEALHESTDAADTSTMDTATQTKTDPYSDEQITAFATGFGITEDDPAKRREAVLAKFTELAPAEAKPVTDVKPVVEDKPVEAAATTAVNEKPADGFSEDEKTKLLADAALGRQAFEEAQKSRINASVNTAAKQGRIAVADVPKWVAFAERDFEFAITQLAAMPPQPKLLTTFGSDENGASADAAQSEAIYAAYAAQTGVPARLVTQGGKA